MRHAQVLCSVGKRARRESKNDFSCCLSFLPIPFLPFFPPRVDDAQASPMWDKLRELCFPFVICSILAQETESAAPPHRNLPGNFEAAALVASVVDCIGGDIENGHIYTRGRRSRVGPSPSPPPAPTYARSPVAAVPTSATALRRRRQPHQQSPFCVHCAQRE